MALASLSHTLFGSADRSQQALEVVLALVFAWLGWRISRAFAAARGVTPWRLPSLVWAVICFFSLVIGLLIELVAQMTTRTDSAGNRPGAPPPAPGYGQVPPVYGPPPGFGQAAPPYGQSAPGGQRPGYAPPAGYGQAPPPYGQAPAPGSTQQPWPASVPSWPTGDVPGADVTGAEVSGAAVPGTAGVGAGVGVGAEAPGMRLPTPPPGRDGKPALFGWYADVTRRHELRYWDGRGWTQFVRDAGVGAVDPV